MAKLIQSPIEAIDAFLHVQSHLLTLITVGMNGKGGKRFSYLALTNMDETTADWMML